jgi:tRNA (mo5U34)-methyltransferase
MSLNLTSLAAFVDRNARDLALRCEDAPAVQRWLATVLPAAQAALARDNRVTNLQAALAELPRLQQASAWEFGPAVRVIGSCDAPSRTQLKATLSQLNPWRKGPFELFDIALDAEWRSDWKWARVTLHITPLVGRRVLDVGCGNGYYLWRMREAGACLVLGLDPAPLALAQFAVVRGYLPDLDVLMLPLASGDLAPIGYFDTVFSMGVLYHRRAPLAHLRELRGALRVGGELVLETLVLVDGSSELLIPNARYCGMRNVWAVPAPDTVERWLEQTGFCDVRVVDVTPTTTDEQRATAWMPTHSLADFLDPHNCSRTIEGYAAPVRAVFTARAR